MKLIFYDTRDQGGRACSASHLMNIILIILYLDVVVMKVDVKTFGRVITANKIRMKRKINYNLNTSRRNIFENYAVDSNIDSNIEGLLKQYRIKHGPRFNWWGDLDTKKTRKLYHKLIDESYSINFNKSTDTIDVIDMYYLACQSIDYRIVAKLYSRERACLHVLLMSLMIDSINRIGVPNKVHEKDRIFQKYSVKLGLSISKHHPIEGVYYKELYRLIIFKSSTTNKIINNILRL